MLCFLDRDGIINTDHGYVGTIERFKLIVEIIPILKYLKSVGYEFVVVTNQSGINRGYYSYKEFIDLSLYIIKLFENYSIPIEINYCRSLPEENSICRKPNIGMFLKYEISDDDIMIGDKDTDMLAAARIGINNRFLINKIPHGPFTKHFNNHLELYGYLLRTFAI